MFKKLIYTVTIALLMCFSLSAYAATENYTPSSDVIFNPERGLYGWGPMVDSTSYAGIRSSGYSLCYAQILLDDFRSSAISASRLNEIEDAFSRMRLAGIKSVVRIMYDDTGSGDDATLYWMEYHLAQLYSIFEDNNDVIAWFQAGMIGAWGEWHSSSNNHHLDPEPVWDLLVEYLPPNQFIAVRTPTFVNTLEGLDVNPLTEESAFNFDPNDPNSRRARIGHHNDCWLGSVNDYGTYPINYLEREAQKDQIANQSKYTPWGGESCNLYLAYVNCATALAEAERFHATYLNASYHPDVIDELTTGGCWQDDFAKKLGYRLQLIDANLPDTIVKGKEFSVTITLENVGWAPVFNERPVFLRIFSGSNIIADCNLTNNADPRRWLPEANEITLSEIVRAPAVIGFTEVDLALWLPDKALVNRDEPDYSVRFANQNVWDAAKGHNVLTLTTQVPVADYQVGDCDNNGTVDFDDLAKLAYYWLDSCSSIGWCEYCDIDESGTVDYLDFAALANYLYE